MQESKDKIIITSTSPSKHRLDKIVSLHPEYNISRSQLQRLIKLGNVSVNGEIIYDISYKVQFEDIIEIIEQPKEAIDIEAKKIPLDIVYEDEYLMIINKPAGLTVHPGAGNKNDTLVNALMYYYKNNLSSIGGEERPGIVHRLDRNTSGLLIVAKDNITHAKLSEELQNRQIKRTYWALVWNTPYKRSGTITTNIDRHKKHRTKMAVSRSSGKLAITHYKLLKTFYDKKISLLECTLETGRTHQIRVHLQYYKMPIIGDPEYCNLALQNIALPDDIRSSIKSLERQALHAKNISFVHPMTNKQLDFTSKLPNDILKIIDTLKSYEDQ